MIEKPAEKPETSSEISHLRQVEKELNLRLNQQAAIASLGQFALTSTTEELMDEMAGKIVEILEVEFCKILELLPDGKELLLKAGAGWRPGSVGQVYGGVGADSPGGFTLLSHEPIIVSDLRKETRFSAPPLLVEHGVTSGMSVIIPGTDHPYGVLGVYTTQKRHFTSDDINFLESAAGVLASAIERARVEAALRSSRNQLNVILQSIADGITVQDMQGNLVYANFMAARMMGYNSAEELLNTPVPKILEKFEILNEEGQPFLLERLPGRLVMKGEPKATATMRFRIRATGEERWSMVRAMPVLNSSGIVELAVNIFQDITGFKREELSQRLLAMVGETLSASLDYATTLKTTAEMCVPELADWCTIHLVEPDGSIQPLALTHIDPGKVQSALEMQRRYPPSWDTPSGIINALRSGKTEFYPEITNEILVKSARSEEHYQALQEAGMRSAILAPLVARGRTLGAITLIWAESGRRYTSDDVPLVEELARRAALAIDNARLYQQSQALNTELEKRVSQRTAQLQTIITKLRMEISERKRAEEALRASEMLLATLFESAPDALFLIDVDGKILRANAQAEGMFGYQREDLIGQAMEILLPEEYRELHGFHRTSFIAEARLRPMGFGLDLFGLRKDGTQFPIDIMLSPLRTDEGVLVISAVRDITERKRIEAELAEVQRRLIERVEAERLHLSQELHDGPIQELYGLTYQLSSLDELLNGDREPVHEYISSAGESMQHVISTLRNICNELRPPALAAFGLDKAIEAHLEKLHASQPDLQIQMDLEADQDRLPERTRLALYRIYQSAVSNVQRHSGATELKVRLGFDTQKILLEIKDNGCGFDIPDRWVELARGGHLGLVGTAERVQAIGGKLRIKSAPGKGTLVQVTLPSTDRSGPPG